MYFLNVFLEVGGLTHGLGTVGTFVGSLSCVNPQAHLHATRVDTGKLAHVTLQGLLAFV